MSERISDGKEEGKKEDNHEKDNNKENNSQEDDQKGVQEGNPEENRPGHIQRVSVSCRAENETNRVAHGSAGETKKARAENQRDRSAD